MYLWILIVVILMGRLVADTKVRAGKQEEDQAVGKSQLQ